MVMSDSGTEKQAAQELHSAEFYPKKLGLFHNDELAPNYVQTHRETGHDPALMSVLRWLSGRLLSNFPASARKGVR